MASNEMRNVLFDGQGGSPAGGQPQNDLNFFQSSYDGQNNMGSMQQSRPVGGGGGGAGGGAFGGFTGGSFSGAGGAAPVNYDDEPPLLEELGINFDHIYTKTYAVLHPRKGVDAHLMDDTDLAGPLVFCLLLGVVLLLAGKVSFGYIYGVGGVGCVAIYGVLNLMSEKPVDIYRTVSVLGYCLLPIVGLAALAVILPLKGILGLFLGGLCVGWCCYAAASMFVVVLHMDEQKWLVGYPVGLFYVCFALITIF
eukprot:GFYU01000706.1.p1 GENE.GFYU01000706.1~~GFYU01000706.1.p1  ORF type:complete len:252 (-),score=57.71 GFYU01000706.1:161-916(-)